MTDMPPKIENTPGLSWRRTETGKWEGRWRARRDLIKRGYRPRLMRLFLGVWPTPAEELYLQDRCNSLQDDMLIWGRGGIPMVVAFDNTVRSLIAVYRSDKDSPYQKLRYKSKEGYNYLCERIIGSKVEVDGSKMLLGDMLIRDIRTRHALRLYEDWSADGTVSMAHSLITMFRTLMSFGAGILENEECARVSGSLRTLVFKNAPPRNEHLTASQVVAIRAEANAKSIHSIAMAQAFQFDLMLRQKDVIGEYVPTTEPGVSAVVSGNEKWLRGVRWDEIDQSMTLRHITSKRQKPIEVSLWDAPMIVEELRRAYGEAFSRSDLPASGPIVVDELTGMPYREKTFRDRWRKMADAAGVPKTVRNMDSRAGAITEATEAEIPIEFVKHAATHSNISMTQRYARDAQGKTATVLKLRAEHRKKLTGE